MSRLLTNSRRSVNTRGLQLVENKLPSVCECVRDEAFYLWFYRGRNTREIATRFREPRAGVEEIIRRKVQERLGGGPGPANSRRAA